MGLDRFRGHRASPDYVYMGMAIMLVLFGLVMIASSSVVISLESYNQTYAFVLRQAIALGIGTIAALVMMKFDYHRFRALATPLLIGSFILILMVFIPGLGKASKGAARWIDLGIFQLQPSELLKISYILYLAAWFERRGKRIKSMQEGLIPFFILLVPLIFFLIIQRDLGTLLVTLVTVGIMYFASGAPYWQIGSGLAVGVILILGLILIAPYRMQRLTTFLHPEADKLGAGYHINQSVLAVGSGGVFGLGFGNSIQKHLYLPEPHTDSIFAIMVEELGFLRAFVVLAAIGFFAYRGYYIAVRAGDDFGRMAAFGITTWLLFQSLINIGAILGLIPLTGVPLPFISYGGTSLVVSLIGVGIVLNISKYRYGA